MPFPNALLHPPCRPVPPPPDLSDDMRVDLDAMLNHFSSPSFHLAASEGSEKMAPLSEPEMMWLSQENLIRFRIATPQGLSATIDRLERALLWRRTVRMDDVEAMAAECEEASTTGKNIISGFAPDGKPIMYLFTARNKLPTEKKRQNHGIFTLERALDLACNGQSQCLVVFNFRGKRQGPPTSIGVAHETLRILTDFYPEVMGQCIVQDAPLVVRAFINIMWPFIEPKTRNKIKTAPGEEAIAAGYVDGDTLLVECGGRLNLPYDHDAYWQTMVDTCLKRRAEYHARWRRLGPPSVGREERLWKRTDDAGVDSDTASLASTPT